MVIVIDASFSTVMAGRSQRRTSISSSCRKSRKRRAVLGVSQMGGRSLISRPSLSDSEERWRSSRLGHFGYVRRWFDIKELTAWSPQPIITLARSKGSTQDCSVSCIWFRQSSNQEEVSSRRERCAWKTANASLRLRLKISPSIRQLINLTRGSDATACHRPVSIRRSCSARGINGA